MFCVELHVKKDPALNTIFSQIEAMASICFLYCVGHFLFEGGFYLPQFPVSNSSDGAV